MKKRFYNKYLINSNLKSGLELLITSFSSGLGISCFEIISFYRRATRSTVHKEREPFNIKIAWYLMKKNINLM